MVLSLWLAVEIGRTLTSAWIETHFWKTKKACIEVALSRVRGLKLFDFGFLGADASSHSHECVD